MNRTVSKIRFLAPCLVAGLLAACSSADSDLERFIADTKKQAGGRVEPLPEVKPYQTFVYSAASIRSPFLPASPAGVAGAPGVRPDSRRKHEFLEEFPIDTLKMVGTLRLAGQTFGLVQTKDGLVHRVRPGNYMGTSEGKVVDISPSKIQVIEIVPDGLGGYMERAAALALNE